MDDNYNTFLHRVYMKKSLCASCFNWWSWNLQSDINMSSKQANQIIMRNCTCFLIKWNQFIRIYHLANILSMTFTLHHFQSTKHNIYYICIALPHWGQGTSTTLMSSFESDKGLFLDVFFSIPRTWHKRSHWESITLSILIKL